MTIYEKIVDGQRKLFGMTGSFPSDIDLPITFKDNDGNTITDINNLYLFYDSINNTVLAEKQPTHVDSDDNFEFSMWCGENLIFGNCISNRVVSQLPKINYTSPDNTYLHVIYGDIELDTGYQFEPPLQINVILTPTSEDLPIKSAKIIINGDVNEMTLDSNIACYSCSVFEDTDLTFEVLI